MVEEGKVLSYRRQKTGALIEMEVSESMQLLIDRYRREDSKYLFPVLEEGATHEQYKHCLAQENQYLADVQVLLGLSAKLTTYVSVIAGHLRLIIWGYRLLSSAKPWGILPKK